MADKETKWTPGPWAVGYNDKRAVLGQRDADGDDLVIATMRDSSRGLNWHTSGQHSVPTKSQSEANARLIAAAPQLYEALYALVSVESWDPETRTNVLDSARAALKAARGEP